MSGIEVLVHEGVHRVRINRPERRNALRARDVAELLGVLVEADRHPELRCVLLGGADGWLCAGGDLSEDTAAGPADAERQLAEFQRVVRALLGLRAPVVVVLEGAAVGAGAAFALAADVCVAATDSRIVVPWIARGLTPDMGVAFFLARQLGAARTKACLLSGGTIPAPQAAHWGLVAEVADEPWGPAEAWASRLAEGPTVATTLTKRLVNQAALHGLDAFLDLERSSMSAVLGTDEPVEGIAAFLERRPPRFHDAAP